MPQTIFITGCSSGIGQAIALHFAAERWNVVATMRNPDDAGPLADKENIITPRLDMTDRASITSGVETATDRFGSIDVLVNNAGFAVIGALEAVSAEQIEQQFSVNVLGTIAMTQAVLPHFRTQQSGTIINISSVVGRYTYPLGSIYDASKFAVEGFSEALRFELEAIGARIKIIEPGLIASDFGSRSMQFAHNPELTSYGPVVAAMGAMAQTFADRAEPAEVVAQVVWDAVHDTAPTLRYPAGQAAIASLKEREDVDDLTFYTNTKERFGL
ncbi:MAG: SDR family oxidoreductase [Pseudomonadota bacterium]